MSTAPYNFVPLADKVYYPGWADKVSNDIPFLDGEDGIITLSIKNITPLFIGNSNESVYSQHILVSEGNRWYFIPGTTLKGCFRSVMEVLSFAKMQVFNDDSFGYRYFTTQRKGMPSYTDSMKDVKCGWLHKEGNKYYLEECVKGIQKIRHKTIKGTYFSTFDEGHDGETAEWKMKSFGNNEPYPLISVGNGTVKYTENETEKTVPEGKYRIVCTGYMKYKHVEYLFSEELHPAVEVGSDIFKKFDTVYKHTPLYMEKENKDGFLKERLNSGMPIPVFFKKNGKTATSMGLSKMYRYPFEYSVGQAVMNCYSKGQEEEMVKKDLPEIIFGCIGDTSLKGRVAFGHAFAKNVISDDNLETPFTTVLATPRASYYPFYVKQNDNSLVSNYSTENAQIAGRKRYRVVEGSQHCAENRGNGNEGVCSIFNPIPVGNEFECKIRIHNLRKAEIGALLSAITFNCTEGTYHNLGKGKPYGFGKVQCEVKSMEGFKFSLEEYIASFNTEIAFFLRNKCHRTMAIDKSLKMLVAIASDTHHVEDMHQMNFNECEANKDENKFEPLTEMSNKNINVLVDEQVVVKEYAEEYLKEQLAVVNKYIERESWEKADSLLIKLKAHCIEFSISNEAVLKVRGWYEQKKKEWEEEQRRVLDEANRIQELKGEVKGLKGSAQKYMSAGEWKTAQQRCNEALKICGELKIVDEKLLEMKIEIGKHIQTIPNDVSFEENIKTFKYFRSDFDKLMKQKQDLSEEEYIILVGVLGTKDKKTKSDFVRKSQFVFKQGKEFQIKLENDLKM